MVWLKRGVWTLAGVLLVLAGVLGAYVARSFPALDGTLQVSGLRAPVLVQRDAADVTHIKAKSARDTWFAIGYVHAQERGWQLEFNRRVMRGALSEVFGAATLDTDKLIRTLGIIEAAQRQWAGLPASGKEALQAYSDGINAFHASSTQALPPEFHILGIRPGRWEPVDSVGWSLMMALDLGGNWGTEFARLSAAQVLDTQRLWELLVPYPGERPASAVDVSKLYADLGIYRRDNGKTSSLKPPGAPSLAAPSREAGHRGMLHEGTESTFVAAARSTAMAEWSRDFSGNAGTVEGKGSNNWVLAGSRTESGKPLLANDPHLGLGAPAIWYFARLQSPEWDVIGATLPGLPFVVLGRTDKVAWGFTNTGPDVQDLYLEQLDPGNPGRYRVPDVDGKPAWAEFSTRAERIKVKGQADVDIVVRATRHGPVLSDAQRFHADVLDVSRFVLALRWSALDSNNQTVQAAINGNSAKSVDELVAAYADYHSPMQNVVMADVSGKIAYKAVGKVPLRKPANDLMGLVPAPGWDARYDWDGWLPYGETPQDDGAKGWIATANQRVTRPDYPHFIGQDWGVPYRFERIEELLAQTPRHNTQSMQKIHADVTSLATRRLLPFLQKAKNDHALAPAALQLLAQFDADMRADGAAPLIFAVWADELTRAILTPKLGEARVKALYGKRQFRPLLELVLERDDAWWCAPQSCAAQSGAALGRALTRLQALYGNDVSAWKWGVAHPARSTHNPFDNVALLAPYFNVSVPTGGDTFTVNAAQYWPNDPRTPFANRHAASMRAIYDLANLENSRFIYQTGQSGLVFSSRYRDMRDTWAGVAYRPLQMQPAAFAHTLTLTP